MNAKVIPAVIATGVIIIAQVILPAAVDLVMSLALLGLGGYIATRFTKN